MKKKILSILIAILALCTCMFTLTACGETVPPHTHAYDQQVVNDTYKASNATCEDKAEYYYSCACGEKGTETFETGSALEHSWGQWTSNGNNTHSRVCSRDNTHIETNNCSGGTATCKEQATCEVCNEKYGDLGDHVFNILKNNETEHWNECVCGEKSNIETHKGGTATCTKLAKCSVCNTEHGEIDATAHSFTNYDYNDDASFGKNGTETATCDNGCGATDTRECVGSAITKAVLDNVVYGKNEGTALAINLAKYELETVSSVVANGAELEFAYENGIVTIANDKLPSCVDTTSKTAVANDVQIVITSGICNFNVSVTIADFAIDSEEDFAAYLAATRALANGTKNHFKDNAYSIYAILTANVALVNEYEGATAGVGQGVIDGRGYTLSNLKIAGPLFSTMTALTIKNLAIVDWVNSCGDFAGYTLATEGVYNNIVIDNCYIDVEVSKYKSTIGLSNNGTSYKITNSVLEMNWYRPETKPTIYPLFRFAAPTLLENVLIISKENHLAPEGKIPGESSANYGLYTSADALYEALNAEYATISTEGFADNENWTIVVEEGKVVSISWANLPLHEHDYNILKNNETTHWNECVCGEKSNIEVHKGGTATCTALAKCSVCDVDYGTLKPHEYESLKQSATQHWYECSCGAYETKENHNPGAEATETTDQKCTECEYVIAPALGHVHIAHLTKVDAKTQSCTEEGNVEYYTCSCGKWFTDKTATTEITDKDSVVIEKDSHKYETLKKTATEHWYECTCGAYETKENHNPGAAATETTDQKCTECGYVITPALGHVHTAHLTKVDAKPQSCTATGNIEYYTCSCGKWFTNNTATTEITDKASVIIAKDSHKYENLKKSETQHWYECTCGAYETKENHNPGAEATETTDQKCTECDYVITSALGHVHTMHLTKVDAKPQSCTTTGNIEYYTCSCGKWFTDKKATTEITDKDSVVIAKDAHKYEMLKKTATEHWWECSCGAYETKENHKGGTATCQVKATCSICDTIYGDFAEHEPKTAWVITDTHHYHECVYGCTEKLNYQEHSFSHYVSDKNATYESDGTKTAQCDGGCGKTHTVTDVGSMLIKDEIRFTTLNVDGKDVYGKVSNATTEFVFYEEIFVSGNATYVVDDDKDGSSPINSKVVDLVVGDNTFYVLETVGNNVNLYTVTIHRRALFIVTFDTNGGTSVDSQIVEEDSFATEPTTTKTGYTFAGWDYDFETSITKDTTITANWKANQYTLTVVYNNGQENKVITQDCGTTIDSIKNPTREGYTFNGWDKEIPVTMPAEDVTITALWNINKYTITFENYDGTILQTGTYNWGDTPVYEGVTPIKEGNDQYSYAFEGFGSISQVSESTTYTAKFTTITNKYSITFKDYNGSVLYVSTVDYGTAAQYNAQTPTRPDDGNKSYEFKQWDKNFNFVTKNEEVTAIYTVYDVYTFVYNSGAKDSVKVIEGQSVENFIPNNTTTKAEGNTEYGYQWEKVDEFNYNEIETQRSIYYITYIADGGEVDKSNPTFVYGDEVYSLSMATKEGYDFISWCTDESLSTPITKIENATSNLTLYAKYDYIIYTILYDLDGGNNAAKNPDIYTVLDNIELKDATKEGYDFVGWYLDEAKTEEIISISYRTGDVDLYAKFTPKSYTATFNDNGAEKSDKVLVLLNAGTSTKYYYINNGESINPYNVWIPFRTGYIFLGWAYESGMLEIDSVIEVSKDIELTAVWKKEHEECSVTSSNILGQNLFSLEVKKYYDTSSDSGSLTKYVYVGYNCNSISYSGSIKSYFYKDSGGYIRDHIDPTFSIYDVTNDVSLDFRSNSNYKYQYYNKSLTCTYKTKTISVEPGTLLRFTASTYSSYSVDGWSAFTVTANETIYDSCVKTTNERIYEQEYDGLIKAPKVTKTGYSLKGWYDEDNVLMGDYWQFTQDKKFTAKWEPIKYYINYVLDGGVNSGNNPNVYTIEDTIEFKEPTKQGYTFKGWYLDEDFTSREIGLFNQTGHITLYAKFEVNTYSLTLDANQGIISPKVTFVDGNDVIKTEFLNSDESIITYLPNDKEGFVFAGWYLDSDFNKVFDFNGIIYEDTMLYARWVECEGEKVNVETEKNFSVSVQGKEEKLIAFSPIVSGYISIASSSDLDLCGKLYDENKNVLISSDDISDDNLNFSYTYYVSAGQVYYISVNGNTVTTSGIATINIDWTNDAIITGSSYLTKTLDIVYGETFVLPELAEREGYTFIGWFDENDEQVYSGVYEFASDKTLTAKWEETI